ncbi:MAG: cadherin-like beta sandwich domain-containing protein [Cytophagaceae bacterium]|jgi:hypothetical protein|nr:cadherin-like beta sandwich domain-containing protein [Cytophagaceae bacterium]
MKCSFLLQKTVLLLLFAAVTGTATHAQSVIASGNCGYSGANLTWKLTSDSTLAISGRGGMYDSTNSDYIPWKNYRERIRRVIIEEGATNIGANAFNGCQKLKSVTIPNTVSYIGFGSFYSCIHLPSITIPSSVTSIGEKAFYYCYWLDTIICKSTTPPSLHSNGAFNAVPAAGGVYVPCSSVAAYQSSSAWSYVNNGNFYAIETLVPENLTVTDVNNGFAIAWQGIANTYQLYRNGELLATVNGMEYTDTDLVDGEEYCYRVKATGGGCESQFGNEICVNKQPSTDATLASLAVSNGVLTPAFNSAITSYTVNVVNSVAAVNIAATASDAAATVAGAGAHPLQIGENVFNIAVTAEDGITTKTYTVRIVREGYSTQATLADLTVSDCVLAPAFNSAVTGYAAEVASSITAVYITATASHAAATVAGTGAKALQMGANLFDITVTAQDGVTTKTYTVNITRKHDVNPNEDATLASLTVSDCVLAPAFGSTVTDYTAEAANSLTAVYIAATASNAAATVAGTGVKMLEVGENRFNITVTAANGITTKTYTVNVIRETPDTDATLASLTVSANLMPAFSSSVTGYTIDFSTVVIAAIATDAAATVAGTGIKVLQTGVNEFDITVTARDGITAKTYTITINHNGVGIDDTHITNSEIKVYPNPTNGIFTLDYDGTGKAAIYNMSGREVFTQMVNGKTEVNICHLPAGVYIVRLFSGTKAVGSVKVVKNSITN